MIPKIIHQMGPDDKNKWPYIWVEGNDLIKKTFPNFEHKLWKNSDVYPFIEKHYPQYFDLVQELPTICKFDFFRCIVMYHYGGLYFDLDFLVYKNFYGVLKHDKPTVIEGIRYAVEEKVQNNFFASPPKLKVWLKVMDEVRSNFKKVSTSDTWYNKVMKITASIFWTKYVEKYPNDFHLLPRDPYNLTKEECANLKEEDIPCRHLGTMIWNDVRNDTYKDD